MTRHNAAKQIQQMREFKKQSTSTKQVAVETLKRAGILGSDGKISDNYPALKASSTK